RRPTRPGAALREAGVGGRPVRDLALLARDVVAAVLVELERHDRHPGGRKGGALLPHSAPQHQPTDPCTTLACADWTRRRLARQKRRRCIVASGSELTV